MSDDEIRDLNLGEKLRRFREARGLSPAELAARSGVAAARIEAIEADASVPAVAELVELARPLSVSVGHFFQRALSERRVEVVRASERFSVEPPSETARALNYRYRSLSYHLSDKLMAPFLVEVPPDDGAEVPAASHQGEEFLFVLSGELEVSVGGETQRLSPGDAIYFDSRLPHTLRAVEGTAVRLVACLAERRLAPAENPLGRAYDRNTPEEVQ